MFSEPTFLPQHRPGKTQKTLLCTPANIPESPASQPVLSKEPSMGNAHLKRCHSNSVPCVLVSLDQSLGCYNPITLCSCQKMFFFLQYAKGKNTGFLEIALNCLYVPKNASNVGTDTVQRAGEKVKSIPPMRSIRSTKTANTGFCGELFEK